MLHPLLDLPPLPKFLVFLGLHCHIGNRTCVVKKPSLGETRDGLNTQGEKKRSPSELLVAEARAHRRFQYLVEIFEDMLLGFCEAYLALAMPGGGNKVTE
jgi:hypothetical protein